MGVINFDIPEQEMKWLKVRMKLTTAVEGGSYCENLLDRYFSDERIFAITGDNFQNGKWRGDASYYFSRYNHCWGWGKCAG